MKPTVFLEQRHRHVSNIDGHAACAAVGPQALIFFGSLLMYLFYLVSYTCGAHEGEYSLDPSDADKYVGAVAACAAAAH